MSNLRRLNPKALITGLSLSLFSMGLSTLPVNAVTDKKPVGKPNASHATHNTSGAPHMQLAHVAILKRLPAKNDVVDGTIDIVEIWFTSAVDQNKSSIAVIGPGKKRADDALVKHSALDPGHVSVGVKDLRDGKYKVRYRALASDGHTVSGSYSFTVKRKLQSSVLH